MGRIFTWEEVENGFIPTPEGFKDVCHFLRDTICRSDAFIGGVIVGSTAHGAATLGSDVDVVTIYKRDQQGEAQTLLRQVSQYAHERYVPLEPISLDNEVASTTLHDVDATLVEHIKMIEERYGSIKRDVSCLINAKSGNEIADTVRYLGRKMAKFRKMWIGWHTLSIEMQLHILGKSLDFPVYAARKILRCKDEFDFHGKDAKSEVVDQYTKYFPELAPMLHEIMQYDVRYNDQICDQLRQADFIAYKDVLNELQEVIPLAQEFARSNLLTFSD